MKPVKLHRPASPLSGNGITRSILFLILCLSTTSFAYALESSDSFPDQTRYVAERIDAGPLVAPDGALGMDRLREALPLLGFRRLIVGLEIGLLPEKVQSYGDQGLELYRSLSRSATDEFRRMLDGVLVAEDMQHFRPIDGMPYVVIEASLEVLDAIERMDQVRSISLETGGIPLLNQSSSFIGAPTAHGAAITGSGKRVAVIDTGIARTHPMLACRVSAEACFSTAAYSPMGSICQAGSYPSSVSVTNMYCFGQNIGSWPTVSGATEYHLQGSFSPAFTAPATYFRGSGLSAFINVPFDSYVRVRGCNMVSCGPWKVAGIQADYQGYCS